MKHLIPFYCIVLIFVSCLNNKEAGTSLPVTADTLAWIVGVWQSDPEDGLYVEQWQRENSSLYTGTAFMIRGTDTLFSERLEIRMLNDSLFYIPVVSGQNEGKPVRFLLKEVSRNRVVFQNLLHDFPQSITYESNQADSLHAWIEGAEQGKYRREDFRLVRVETAPEIQVE